MLRQNNLLSKNHLGIHTLDDSDLVHRIICVKPTELDKVIGSVRPIFSVSDNLKIHSLIFYHSFDQSVEVGIHLNHFYIKYYRIQVHDLVTDCNATKK